MAGGYATLLDLPPGCHDLSGTDHATASARRGGRCVDEQLAAMARLARPLLAQFEAPGGGSGGSDAWGGAEGNGDWGDAAAGGWGLALSGGESDGGSDA